MAEAFFRIGLALRRHRLLRNQLERHQAHESSGQTDKKYHHQYHFDVAVPTLGPLSRFDPRIVLIKMLYRVRSSSDYSLIASDASKSFSSSGCLSAARSPKFAAEEEPLSRRDIWIDLLLQMAACHQSCHCRRAIFGYWFRA